MAVGVYSSVLAPRRGAKLKILEILHREGKALVALNTMLYADNVNDQLLAETVP